MAWSWIPDGVLSLENEPEIESEIESEFESESKSETEAEEIPQDTLTTRNAKIYESGIYIAPPLQDLMPIPPRYDMTCVLEPPLNLHDDGKIEWIDDPDIQIDTSDTSSTSTKVIHVKTNTLAPPRRHGSYSRATAICISCISDLSHKGSFHNKHEVTFAREKSGPQRRQGLCRITQ
jgi:hypothetical protein